MTKKWSTYGQAVEFAAINFDPLEMRKEFIADRDTTILIAEVFDSTPDLVAEDILRYRLKNDPNDTGDPAQIPIFEPIEKGGLKLER